MNIKNVLHLLFLTLFSSSVYSQVSPFKLSTKWYFGNYGGMDFLGGIPLVLTGGQVNSFGQEGSSTITDRSGNVVFYTDGYELYDGNHNFIQYVRGGTSSTQNSVAIPDPADPDKRYYLFTANVEPSSGGQRVASIADLGINYYHIEKTATSIQVIAGPVQIAQNNEVSEQLCVGADLSGNYWIVSHQGGDWTGWNMKNIYSWHVTSVGVGSRTVSTLAGITGNNPWLGSMKINKCQTKLAAVHNTGVVEVFEWDALTGKIVSLLHRSTGYPSLYGCEFSSSGEILYFTSENGNKMYQLEISSGTIYTDPDWKSANNTPWMGTLQLGPDNKIYVTNGNNAGSPGGTPSYIGVVNNPDVAGAGCNYDGKGFLLNAGPDPLPNIERGIANIGWLAPGCEITVNDLCPDFSFSYSVKNYFNETISVIAGSEEWNFDEGAGFESGLGATPTHHYSRSDVDTVKLRFKDQVCNRTWSISKKISVNCILPVTWVSVDAKKQGSKIVVSWATSSEVNNKEFILERSADGLNFFPIGLVHTSEVNENGGLYHYDDLNPLQGVNYYRIRQVDLNSAYQFSSVVEVQNEDLSVEVYPNPSNRDFKIVAPDIKGKLFVFDLLGREISSDTFDENISFGEDLPAGQYVVKLVYNDSAWSVKIVKEL